MNRELTPDRIDAILHELCRTATEYAQKEEEARKSSRRQQWALDHDCDDTDHELVAELQADEERAREEHRDARERIEGALAARTAELEADCAAVEARLRTEADRTKDAARQQFQQAAWVAKNAYQQQVGLVRHEWQEAKEELARLSELLSTLQRTADRLFTRFRRSGEYIRPLDSGAAEDSALDGTIPERLQQLDADCLELKQRLTEYSRLLTATVIRHAGAPLLVCLTVVVHICVALVLRSLGVPLGALATSCGSALGCSLLIVLVVHLAVKRTSHTTIAIVSRQLARIGQGHDELLAESRRVRAESEARLAAERDEAIRRGRETCDQAVLVADEDMKASGFDDLQPRLECRKAEAREQRDAELAQAERRLGETLERLQREAEDKRRSRHDAIKQRRTALLDQDRGQFADLVQAWQDTTGRIQREIESLTRSAADAYRAWDDPGWEGWTPPRSLVLSAPFAELDVDMATLVGDRLPQDDSLALPTGTRFSLPLALAFPGQCSLLLQTRGEGRQEGNAMLEQVMLRLLTTLPPGKVSFTIIDPIGLGQSFAGFMHLADFEESLVGGRIWTDARQIEQRLAELNEHMEKVIQMYLRNEYATITDYNRRAGQVAERYRFLVIADFPVEFSETAARRLLSIITSGPRCGVYTLIGWDRRQALPPNLTVDDLCRHAVRLTYTEGRFVFRPEGLADVPVVLGKGPSPDRLKHVLQEVGRASIDSSRVEVPFSDVAPDDADVWSEETSALLRVPIGRRGATKLQCLELGRGTSQHALIAGKTGSGKSTLLHVLVTNLSLWCSPDEVEFYLVDFKKGVEFKAYATSQLPHLRAVAIESDREFGLSVLDRVDQELKRRGTLFRDAGVQDLRAYRARPDAERLPRTLLIIDEFQEYFVQDDRIAQNAALLMDRLVRQGRAFGIHVLLGSQTLGGAYTLARTTLGQMTIRIALQCAEADSYLILSDDNGAARFLSRPGEAIYNDAAGLEEANVPFQVVWLSDDERNRRLEMVGRIAEQRGFRRRDSLIVFEGNAPGDVSLNRELRASAEGEPPATPPLAPRAWLGEPNAIKSPTCATLRRQSGSNLIAIGQYDEAALSILAAAAAGLAAQHAPDQVRFVVLDGSPPDSAHAGYLARFAEALPYDVLLVSYREVPDALAHLAEEVTRRQTPETGHQASVYLLVHGLQRYKQIRFEEDFGFSLDDESSAPNPGQAFDTVLREGPDVGVHALIWCDTLANVNRALSRRALSELELRVLFQMSATDSATLIDSPQASQLGLHRALLHNEQEGTTEKFRPYSLPGEEWLSWLSERLTARSGGA